MANDDVIKLVHIPPKEVQVSMNVVWIFATDDDAKAFIECVKQTSNMAECKAKHKYRAWREATDAENGSYRFG